MFSSLSQFFKNDSSQEESASDQQHRLRLATCVLLLEAAHADDEFSAEENLAIDAMVGSRFSLDPAETGELLELAEKERQGGGDLYQFARLVNDQYSKARKLAILELLWEIVYSDGVLEAHEDALMHKLGTLLSVRHEELMAVKVSVRRKLGLS
jgi:uncharacterized tellurite resistance protein B-like protein